MKPTTPKKSLSLKSTFFLSLFILSFTLLKAQCPDGLSVSVTSQTNNNCNGYTNGSITVTVPPGSSGSANYVYTGSVQTFTVPAGVTTATITASGGQGGNGNGSSVGGNGAALTGIVS